MRILQLTPGTGTYLCGSCMRDNVLAAQLRALGHDAIIAPLYLPFALEEAAPSGAEDTAVHMGGINVYLQQRFPLLRHLPRCLHDKLDSPRLLRYVARRAGMTDTAGLGAMALSMLRGEEGRQRAELELLVEWVRGLGTFDAVLLSNVMLVGLARELRAALNCPVFSTLQGEAPFLDALAARYRNECWRVLGERARELDGFLAVSRYTSELMRERLQLAPERVHVVWNGLDCSEIVPRAGGRVDSAPVIGYLARMCRDKGLPLLFDAFLQVKRAVPDARLVAAGVVLAEDRVLLADLARRAREAGVEADVELIGPVTRAQKLQLLQRFDVFSVPAHYGESFGLYLLEAWAAGLPVVQPRHGAFPELLEETGGGVLVEPNDAAALAAGLVTLLRVPARRVELGARGASAVRERFTGARMASDVAACLRERTRCGVGP
jgi:glycosyltransferase involved in cell wall biosynthesis